jgi:hypothetical protein
MRVQRHEAQEMTGTLAGNGARNRRLVLDREGNVVENSPPRKQGSIVLLEDVDRLGRWRGDDPALEPDLPAEAGISPATICSSVDFPQPEGPTMATNSPRSTVNEI